MKKELMAFGTKVVKKATKESPTLLIGVGIAAGVSAIAFAIKATPKAHDILAEHEQAKQEIEHDLEERDINKDEARKAKAELIAVTSGRMIKNYAPTIIFEVLSIASIIMSHRISLRRQMALTALYMGSEAALSDKLQEIEQLQKLLPNKKVEDAKQAAAEEKVKKKVKNNPPTQNAVYQTPYGTQLCLDYYTGDWFFGDPETIRQKFGDLDDTFRDETCLSIEEIHQALGLPKSPMAKDVGFNTSYCQHLRPEYRFMKLDDIVDREKDIRVQYLPPLTSVFVIDYSEYVKPLYNWYGDN